MSQQFELIELPVVEKTIMLEFDIYTKSGNAYVPLLSKGHKLNKSDVTELVRSKQKLYIASNESWEYTTFMKHVVIDKAMSLEEHLRLIYAIASDTLQNFFENVESVENMQECKKVSHDILKELEDDQNCLVHLMNVSSHDYYTYTHCINVSMYSIALGLTLKLKKEELRQLAEAAILHDIGKCKVNKAIINKDGPLSDDEFFAIQKHAKYGYLILTGLGEKDRTILEAILYHHEKCDGSGYPEHLLVKQIPYFAQIISVADVFDALTTRRSYKRSLSSFEALKMMRSTMKSHLNQELVLALVSTLRIK